MSLRHAAFFFLLLVPGPAFAKITKVDPLIKHLAKEGRDYGPRTTDYGLAKALSATPDGRLFVDCFVKVYDPAQTKEIAARIEELGGTVRTLLTRIMTASLPLEEIETVAGWSEVRYIEAGKPLLPKMDTARTVTNVDDVNNGTNLDKRYDGSGVIIGIVDDTRPDYDHADFTDASGNTRIKFYWDKNTTGSGVSEISGSTGLECAAARIDAGTCNATAGGSADSHATHVAGIAAGDDSTYKGVAPGADIIFVFNVETDADSGGNLSTTIVDDVRYVFNKADTLNQPAVVNLSLGTSIGAHDDTSSMEDSLNDLVNQHPGRAIVNAAGNERFNSNDTGADRYAGLHAAVAVTSGTDEGFEFEVRSGSTLGTLGDQVIVDIWLNAASTCTVELDAFDDADAKTRQINMAAVSSGNSSPTTSGAAGTSGTVTLSVDFTDSTNANNGKKHAQATVTFSSAVTNAQIEALTFDVIFRGTCAGDAWIWPDRNSTVSFTSRSPGSFGYTYVAGDSNRTITIPATASGLIAAASFMSKQSWTDTNGTSHNQTATSGTDFTSLGATGGTVSNISLFSSLGPTPDGRTKPDIAAPGEPIVASMSSSNTVATGRKVDANHFKNEGTSMSSPHVAGIVALMFQKNPCLTSNQVKTLITDNAATDSFTGTTGLPNNTWGYGKIDALEIMKDIATLSGTTCGLTGSTGIQNTAVTTTSGTAGGGGCFRIGPRTTDRGLRTTDHGPRTLFVWGIFLLLVLTIRFRLTSASSCNPIHATQSARAFVEKNQTGNSPAVGQSSRR
ncbi:MAG: S8 family serine peptidase [Deltaproteobacteria bacterium]|nr:S8 family serine peptidase [Deltaproteobacteria bacterium]